MSNTTLPSQNKRWVLNEYTTGPLNDQTFKMETVPLAADSLKQGEILVKVATLGFEPAMRPSYSLEKSYRDPQPLHEPLWAFGLGEVVVSKNDKFKVGTNVFSMMSMSEYHVLDGDAPNVREVDPKMGKQYLSILAPPGLAAHVGLFDVAQLKKGDVVMVSSAAGATGGLCVQMAKRVGAAKIIGIASARKCKAVIANGADECIAYDEEGFEEKLKKATDGKVSVYFENVGGHVLDAALPCMAPFGRIAVCGMIADYDRLGSDEGFNAVKNLRFVLTARLRVEGFICAQRGEKALNTAFKELAEWAAEGTLHTEVHTHPQKGVEHCIDALKALLKGENHGKMTLDMF